MAICSKLIFRRLLIKLVAEYTFIFNSKFLKQVNGCTMGGQLSVTFSDIYVVKLENDVVISSKPIFYWKFVDDIYSRWKLGDNILFDQLNNYHPNIKLTIEVIQVSIWIPNSPTSLLPKNSTFIGKTQNWLHHGPAKLQNAINEIQWMVIFIVQKEYHQTLTKQSLW